MKKLALAALLLAGLLFAVPTDDPDSANCPCECGCECECGAECACGDACECECNCDESCADASECACKEVVAETSSCGGMNMGSCGGCGR